MSHDISYDLTALLHMGKGMVDDIDTTFSCQLGFFLGY
jgi:hypothetical protein